MTTPTKPRSRNLPVGITLTFDYTTAEKRRLARPEDRRHYICAHICRAGKQHARRFNIHTLGKRRAIKLALKWRRQKERELGRPVAAGRPRAEKSSPSEQSLDALLQRVSALRRAICAA